MTPIQYTLLAILAFVAIALGSFVWFIANWDKSRTKPIGAAEIPTYQTTAHFCVSRKSWGLGQGPSTALTSGRTST